MPTATDRDQSTKVRLTLDLPDNLLSAYERMARSRRLSLEQLLAERLMRCRDHNATQPIYLDDNQRQELVHMTGGHLIRNGEEAMARIRNTCRVRVGDVTLDVDQRLMERLKSRAAAERRPVEVVIQREAERGLKQFCMFL